MMDKARDLFDAAVSIARPLRESYVRRHAAGDDALMHEVLRLLEFDEPTTEHGGLAGDATRGGGSVLGSIPASESLVKGYRLTQRQSDWCGGELWLAEPAGSVGGGGGGRVFISLLPRPDSIRAALSRWRLVRPQLDALTGPTIARIIDAGRTTDDRLFLVMPAFLPLTLNDWLLHHTPSAAEMLSVIRAIEAALAELAKWGLLHGAVTIDAVRLRVVVPRSGDEAAKSEPIIDVQLVGSGLMQILATHTVKGQALSVEGDHAGVVAIARRMIGDLLHRAGLGHALSQYLRPDSKLAGSRSLPPPPDLGPLAGSMPSPAGGGPAISPSDPAFGALLAITGSQIRTDGGVRIVSASAMSENSGLLRSSLNKHRGTVVYSAAAALAAALLAGTLVLLGSQFLLPVGMSVWRVVAVCSAAAAIGSGACSLVALARMRQERNDDVGV